MSKYFPYIFWCMLAVALVLSFMVANEMENRRISIEDNLDKTVVASNACWKLFFIDHDGTDVVI